MPSSLTELDVNTLRQIFGRKREDCPDLLPYILHLHGRVTDDALEAACFYEYARLSLTLREAARLYKQGISEMEAVFVIGGEASTNCLLNPPWSFIWTAPSFPDRS
jgi:hypothetical protein